MFGRVMGSVAIITTKVKEKNGDSKAYRCLYKDYCMLRAENEQLKKQIKVIREHETEWLNDMSRDEYTRYMNEMIFS